MAGFERLENVSTSNGWRMPRLVLPRQVGPENLQELNRVIMLNIGSKDLIPLLIEGSQGRHRLIDDVPLLRGNQVIGLVLGFILEVVKDISSIRGC